MRDKVEPLGLWNSFNASGFGHSWHVCPKLLYHRNVLATRIGRLSTWNSELLPPPSVPFHIFTSPHFHFHDVVFKEYRFIRTEPPETCSSDFGRLETRNSSCTEFHGSVQSSPPVNQRFSQYISAWTVCADWFPAYASKFASKASLFAHFDPEKPFCFPVVCTNLGEKKYLE